MNRFLTNEQLVYRRKLLYKIHRNPNKYYNYNEPEIWQEFLNKHFGVDSCRYLVINELCEVLDLLNHSCFAKKPNNARDKREREALNNYLEYDLLKGKKASVTSINYAYGLCSELKLNNKRIIAFIKKQIGREAKLHMLKGPEIQKVIIGLEAWQKSQDRKVNKAYLNWRESCFMKNQLEMFGEKLPATS